MHSTSSVLDIRQYSASRPALLTHGEMTPVTPFMGDRVSNTACLNVLGRRTYRYRRQNDVSINDGGPI